MRRWPVLLLMTVLVLTGCAAPPRRLAVGPRLSSHDLDEDVDVLQHAYEALHPGLYRYNTPADMRRHFDGLRAALAHDPSLGEAYLAFSAFAATVRCGHTYANFYNQPEAIRRTLLEAPTRVPFYFRWVDGRMIVTRNFSSDPSVVPGSEIVAIDGEPSRTLLRRMLPLARADGSNDAKRVAWLQVQGEDTYEAFDVFLPLLHPGLGPNMTIDVAAPNGHARRTITVDGLSYAQRLATRPKHPQGDGPVWSLDRPEPDLAVLSMPSWALYESHWDWKAYLTQVFTDLEARHVPALVIDLRSNEGGLSVGDELLGHLIDRPVEAAAYDRLVRYRKVPDDLSPYLHTWDASFKDWGNAAVPRDDRYFRLTRWDNEPGGDAYLPVAPHYHGRVFVLIGPTNSSATFEFALAAKTTGLATLVGQTTGGNRRGINGGAFFFLGLPHSGIELDVPLIGQFPRTPQPDAGVEPDIRVTRTVGDIVDGRDAELDAVRRALRAPAH